MSYFILTYEIFCLNFLVECSSLLPFDSSCTMTFCIIGFCCYLTYQCLFGRQNFRNILVMSFNITYLNKPFHCETLSRLMEVLVNFRQIVPVRVYPLLFQAWTFSFYIFWVVTLFSQTPLVHISFAFQMHPYSVIWFRNPCTSFSFDPLFAYSASNQTLITSLYANIELG